MSVHENDYSPYSWQCLAVGDVVEITKWPGDLHRELLHQDTIDIYDLAISRRLTLRVHHIDRWGIPYGELVLLTDDSNDHHFLGLNHDCITLVSKGGS